MNDDPASDDFPEKDVAAPAEECPLKKYYASKQDEVEQASPNLSWATRAKVWTELGIMKPLTSAACALDKNAGAGLYVPPPSPSPAPEPADPVDQLSKSIDSYQNNPAGTLPQTGMQNQQKSIDALGGAMDSTSQSLGN